MPAIVSRRQRLRLATVEEIKRVAWAQMGREGSAALSLRGVAREMGMAPSALYRYFPSRDDLVTELVTDGFNSLAEALEAADAAAALEPLRTPPQRWVEVARAHRTWALANRAAYGLIYGAPIPGYERHPGSRVAMQRTVAVLFAVMRDMVAAGLVDLARLDSGLDPDFRRQLDDWIQQDELRLPAAAVAFCMTCWTTLHGAISLDVYGRFPRPLRPAQPLFEQQMRDVIRGGMPTPSQS